MHGANIELHDVGLNLHVAAVYSPKCILQEGLWMAGILAHYQCILMNPGTQIPNLKQIYTIKAQRNVHRNIE